MDETPFRLEFTPLEFETYQSLGGDVNVQQLEFTPLEFETSAIWRIYGRLGALEFTPLEFETQDTKTAFCRSRIIRIYSVGV